MRALLRERAALVLGGGFVPKKRAELSTKINRRDGHNETAKNPGDFWHLGYGFFFLLHSGFLDRVKNKATIDSSNETHFSVGKRVPPCYSLETPEWTRSYRSLLSHNFIIILPIYLPTYCDSVTSAGLK